MRDERVEAFASLLWDGVHEYTYVARATTPGNFVVPPPKAEEMYMPETFGRGGSDRVIVELKIKKPPIINYLEVCFIFEIIYSGIKKALAFLRDLNVDIF